MSGASSKKACHLTQASQGPKRKVIRYVIWERDPVYMQLKILIPQIPIMGESSAELKWGVSGSIKGTKGLGTKGAVDLTDSISRE